MEQKGLCSELKPSFLCVPQSVLALLQAAFTTPSAVYSVSGTSRVTLTLAHVWLIAELAFGSQVLFPISISALSSNGVFL